MSRIEKNWRLNNRLRAEHAERRAAIMPGHYHVHDNLAPPIVNHGCRVRTFPTTNMKRTTNLPPLWWLNPWKAARRLSVTLDHVRAERDMALSDATEAYEARAEDDRKLHDILSKGLPDEMANAQTRPLAHMLNMHAQQAIRFCKSSKAPEKSKPKPRKR